MFPLLSKCQHFVLKHVGPLWWMICALLKYAKMLSTHLCYVATCSGDGSVFIFCRLAVGKLHIS